MVQALAPAGEKQWMERGERLFSVGEAAKGVYLILKGTARASLSSVPGRELVCRTAGPGSVLGLPSALCANSYEFDVQALESMEVIFLSTESVNQILRREPELCMQVMNMMCDELSTLRQTREQMRNCAQHSCLMHGGCTHSSAS